MHFKVYVGSVLFKTSLKIVVFRRIFICNILILCQPNNICLETFDFVRNLTRVAINQGIIYLKPILTQKKFSILLDKYKKRQNYT